jgi:hypothetical protein
MGFEALPHGGECTNRLFCGLQPLLGDGCSPGSR